MELLWKGLAVFGCIFLMTLTTEEFVLPVLDEARVLLVSANSFSDAALVFAETISRLLFPFMVIFLLLFLALFEYLCNFFAEVTREYQDLKLIVLPLPNADKLFLPMQALLTDVSTLTGGTLATGYVCDAWHVAQH